MEWLDWVWFVFIPLGVLVLFIAFVIYDEWEKQRNSNKNNMAQNPNKPKMPRLTEKRLIGLKKIFEWAAVDDQMIEWYGSMNPWAAESIRSALKYLEEYIAFLESNRK